MGIWTLMGKIGSMAKFWYKAKSVAILVGNQFTKNYLKYSQSYVDHLDQKIWVLNLFFKIWIIMKRETNWARNMLMGNDNNTYNCKYITHL